MRTTRPVLALLAALVTSAAAAQPIDTAKVDRLMLKALADWKVPGASVAIVRDDKVVYVKGYGIKEIGKTDPVTADTLFGIASTTKAFTATAMAMMVDEKKMAWDDPVRKHLEYFRLGDACTDSLVTLRDTVTHRTGLVRHDELWDNTSLTREQVIRAAGAINVSRPIRTAYQYSNIGFITAGEAVASAAKMPWDDFVRTRIFAPLGMTRTITSYRDFLTADHATGHRYHSATDSIGIQTPNDDFNLGPAGSIKSTARDMAQWVRFQLADGTVDGKRLVSAEALGETKTPQIVIRPDAGERASNPLTHVHSYAMGWNVQDYRGELLLAHTGALNGFRTQVDLLPELHAGFVVMINAGRSSAVIALRNALADVILGVPQRDWDAYYLALDKKNEDSAETKKREREAKRITGNPTHELAAYAGTYTNPAYGEAVVAAENGALVVRWQRIALPLAPYSFDTFEGVSEADDLDELVTFKVSKEGAIQGMTLFDEPFVKK